MPMRWSDLSLAARFGLAGGAVMLFSMLVLGLWVTARIEAGVINDRANATARYMESFVAPLSQELARSDTLSPGAQQALWEVFHNSPHSERVKSFRIWKPDGFIAYASNRTVIGKQFTQSSRQEAAWSGTIEARYLSDGSTEPNLMFDAEESLLEIYSPIRAAWSGEIIAIAEIYEATDFLETEIADARTNTWLIVIALVSGIYVLLFGIVLSGSRTIEVQRQSLTQRVSELTALAEQNAALTQRLKRASAGAVEMNENFLAKLSAELHDGPTQLLGFAKLRIHKLHTLPPEAAETEIAALDSALTDAVGEIRDICRGLALPDIHEKTLPDLVRYAVNEHIRRTGTAVSLDLPDRAWPAPSQSHKICLVRFVQEGLANAFHHAKATEVSVEVRETDGMLRIQVCDRGPGFGPAEALRGTAGLGLRGLKQRAESLGGAVTAANRPEGGARLEIRLNLLDEQSV